MSKCDLFFREMCRDILEGGITTEGEKVRPHWADGTSAYTIKEFCRVTRYDLKEEPPVLTLRGVPVKNSVDELLWIWQKKSNNIADLNSKIWDDWADENGTIGKAYGYQLAEKHRCKDVSGDGLLNAFPDYELSDAVFSDPKTGRIAAVKGEDGIWRMDQVDKVIYDLKNTPFSRRIMTTLWNPEELADMRLAPCAYSMTFNITTDKETGGLELNGILNQRSQDVLTAFAWNEFQYGVLLYMLSQVCGFVPGEFVHVIADAHIYDRHVDMIEELLGREDRPAPKFWLNPDVGDFYAFTPDDVKLIGYETAGPQLKNIPVAV